MSEVAEGRIGGLAAELLARRERLDVVLEHMTEGVTITDAGGGLVYANAAAARLIGVASPEALVALPAGEARGRFQIFREDGSPMPPEELPGRRALAGDDAGEAIVRFRPVDGGHERVSLVRAVAARDAEGRIEYVVNFFREVTEQRQSERRVRVQHAVTAILTEAESEEEAIPRVLEAIADLLEWDAGAYWEVDAAAGVATCRTVHAGPHLDAFAGAIVGATAARGDGLVGEIWKTREPRWIPNLDAHDDLADARDAAVAGIRTGFGFASVVGGDVVGVLQFFARDQRSADPELIEVVAALGRNVGQFVQRQRAEQERARLLVAEQDARATAEGAALTLQKLARVSEAALEHISLDDLLDALLERLVEVLDADTAAIALGEDDGAFLVTRATFGLEEEVERGIAVPLGQGLAGRVAATRAPLLVDDVDEIEIYSPVLRARGLRSIVAIPLVVEERVIGVAHVGSEQHAHFTQDDVRLLELIADRIALAVNHSALNAAERDAQERLAFMGEASTLLASSLEYEQTLGAVARLAVPRRADWCAVDMLVDGEIRRLAVTHSDPAKAAFAREVLLRRPPSLDDPALGALPRVLRTGEPVLVENLTQEAIAEALGDDPELRDRFLELGLRSYMIVPIVVRGRTVGALSFVWAESPRRYTPADLTFAQELASRAAIAIDNAQLYREAEEGRRRLGFLAEASALLASALDAETALVGLGELVVGRIADWCAIHLGDEQGVSRIVTIAHSDPEKAAFGRAYADSVAPSPEAEHGVANVVRTGEPELFPSIPRELLAGPVAEAGIHSTLIVPLRARGRTLGALTLAQAESPRSFTEADVEFAEEVGRRAGVAVENAQLYREAAERAQAARVLASVGDGVVLVDRHGVVRYWNRAAAAITALSDADVVDRPIAEAIPGWATIAGRAPVAAEGATNPRPESLPLALGHREVWLSVAGIQVGDGIIYVFRDLTEDRALDEMKTEFVSTVSHELRTPLAAIYGAAMTLRRTDVRLDSDQRENLLTVVSNEADRLARTVNAILWASRLDTDTLRVAIESCDPLELTRDVVTAQQAHLAPGIELRVDTVERLPPVAADRDKVGQVLVNLVENGVKYSPDGGAVVVGVRTAGAQVRFSVTDEGLGIPYAEQRRIFEKFYRLDPNMTRGIGGTGLGLYICRELIRRMGGRIWVESEPGRGSTFSFELPIAGTEADVAAHVAGGGGH